MNHLLESVTEDQVQDTILSFAQRDKHIYFLSGPAPLKKKKSEDKGAAKVEKEGWSGKYSILIGQL